MAATGGGWRSGQRERRRTRPAPPTRAVHDRRLPRLAPIARRVAFANRDAGSVRQTQLRSALVSPPLQAR